jgi:excisionase family DNA binding protein
MLAKLLGVSRITVYKRVKRGDIPARKIGKMYVITDRTVMDLLGKGVSSRTRQQIETAVRKTVSDYGDLLKRLGSE